MKPSIILCLLSISPLSSAEPGTALSYEKPATHWLEALPIGNGRMGAMIFGGAPEERIQFNEQTLWTGTNRSQGWLDTEKRNEGTRDGAMGDYQPFGDVFLRFPQEHQQKTAYRRELDLSTGIATTTYQAGGVVFTREVFASHPDRVVVMRLTSNTPGALTFRVAMQDAKRPPLPPATTTATPSQLEFSGKLSRPEKAPKNDLHWNNMAYQATLRVLQDGGTSTESQGEISISKANSVTLLLAAATDYLASPAKQYRGDAPGPKVKAALDSAAKKSFSQLRATHLADHQGLFGRVNLRLAITPASLLPTDQRLAAYQKNGSDPALEALLFQYGRYLLIASSRPGGLPANLQGIWNDKAKPAWYSGYTTNINVEMNYWPAETTHLAECHQPLFDWLDNLAVAQKLNPDPKLRTPLGWIIYSTNNPLGGNSGWAFHLPGSAWLSQHFYEAWAFGGDREFLAKRAYPHLRELTRMWDARLVDGPDGSLITPDGWSPEHGPVKLANGKTVIKEGDRTPQPGASYDQQIIWDLFSNFIDAATALDRDPDLRQHITERRARLLGPKVGRFGQIQEWKEDVDNLNDDYRHIGQLFALHPGRQISPITTPDFAKAAKVTLDARSDKSCGWSRALKIGLRARLHDGNHAGKVVRSMLEFAPAGKNGAGTYSNLFGAGPPFQIDSNFGYTAGVAEMLLQSHLRSEDGRREIHLLPAIPDSWASGEATGLCARDGFTVDQQWENGKLVSATLFSKFGRPLRIRYQGKTYDFEISAGSRKTFDPDKQLPQPAHGKPNP